MPKKRVQQRKESGSLTPIAEVFFAEAGTSAGADKSGGNSAGAGASVPNTPPAKFKPASGSASREDTYATPPSKTTGICLILNDNGIYLICLDDSPSRHDLLYADRWADR